MMRLPADDCRRDYWWRREFEKTSEGRSASGRAITEKGDRMHVAKCLMTVERVELHKLHEVVRFECEYDANNPGDRAFASGTPVGHFLVELTNSELASQFKPGDRYYLELSRQVEPEPMTVSAPASIDVSMNPYNDAKWVPCVSIGQLLQPAHRPTVRDGRWRRRQAGVVSFSAAWRRRGRPEWYHPGGELAAIALDGRGGLVSNG